MEAIVAPNTNVAKKGIIIGSIVKLGRGLGGFSTRRNH
jgi:hypothetical protein